MDLLEQLTKIELLELARQHQIKASSRLKKKELIILLSSMPISDNFYRPARPKKPKKTRYLITTPNKTIRIQEKREIIILPQSHVRVFLIWKASPEYNTHTQAWLIKTDKGYMEKVPPSSRSVFLDRKYTKNNIKLFRIKQNGDLEFFAEVKGKTPKYNIPSQKEILYHFDKYHSSGLHFK